MPNPDKAETALVNGKHLYYEIYGEGSPLLFLHGYGLSSIAWHSYVDDYIEDYQVILIDLTGNGRSDPFQETLSIRSVGEDLQALVHYLKLEKLQAIGFSYGGDVLFQLALLEPQLVESMVTIGALGSWDVNDFPNLIKMFTREYVDLTEYHSGDEQLDALFAQFPNYTVTLSDEELQSIKTNVLLVMGDDDPVMTLEEAARVRKHLPHSDLWVLPNVSDSAHTGQNKPDFVRISKAFLARHKTA
ncbi:MAG: alpha/beta hydrolase [Pseudomonadota bacterium]